MRFGQWALLLALVAGGVRAGDTEHVRGDFRFSVGAEPAFITRREIPAQWDTTAPGANEPRWRYWLYDIQADRRAGRDLVYADHVFEPKSQSLIGEAGRFQITFNPNYQRLLIHRVELRRDGRWLDRLFPDKISLARRESGFEQDLADGEVTALIVLDDVRVDDVIRVSYTVAGSNPILAGQTADWTQLGWHNPVLDSYLRVLDDPGSKLRAHRENAAPEPVIRTTADGVEALAHKHGAAAVINEENYPLWYQPYPTVQIAVDRSWADVVTWALPLYPKVDALPDDLEARIAAWVKIADPHARMKALLRTVQDEIRYFGVEMGDNTHRPTPPAETWRRRYGDCKDKAYLLSTLLGRVGLQGVPALVSTQRGRALKDFVPTASVFNHVVVRATVAGTVLWVDPTMTQEGGDPRDSDLSPYGVALPITAGVAALETIAPGRDANDGIQSVEQYVPSVDGRSIKLRIETVYQGRSANYARRSLASERSEDLSRRYADYYRKRYGDLDVLASPTLADDREANTLKTVETYELKSPFENEGGVRALEVYGEALQGTSVLPPSMARTGPLDFAQPSHYRHEVQIELPERWSATFGNEDVSYASTAFDYKRDLKVADRSVKLVYDMRVKETEVMPERVAAHLGELRKLRESLSARLRFHMPAGLDQQQRDQRLKALLKDVIDGGAKE
ncbi:DUF3857 domain-containing protein [Lysobacter sp. CFH 32150]|uniref:DUF3857 domain-containing protein n=1 Tax=Lysobacter sp. CFH 32150 TaxID=2927128 RepID=UPI001FA7CCBC|nr:DUF3857 domain-containing protein [Lysobacter sp. CFH 32150]MCI4568615.1 DUF3857 domain-containing transglutaminase family protein [Lysobacter sp. CFH 32150]